MSNQFPTLASAKVLLEEVTLWRGRLSKNEVKPFADELRFIGSWLDAITKHLVLLQEIAENGGADDEVLSPETALNYKTTVMELVAHTGGIEMLPLELKQRVVEMLEDIEAIQAEEAGGDPT